MHPTPRDYSFIAPVYDKVFHRFLNQGHARLGKLLRTKARQRGLKVLEVGVGSGLSLDHIPTRVDFLGVDINDKMLSLAKLRAQKFQRKKIELKQMSVEKLSLRSNSYDLVMAASVLTAVSDPLIAMREMIRVTKAGGQIAIIANLREKDSVTGHVIRSVDPVAKKYLGFTTDLPIEFFSAFGNIKLERKEKVNTIMGYSLSTFLVFRKLS